MGQLTQENRLVAISDFSLGKDTFLVRSLEGTERVSDVYSFTLTLVSEKLDIKAKDVMGKLGHVTVQDENQRQFSGHVDQFTVGEVEDDNLRTYTMVLKPWLSFLQYTNNHRVFQDMTTKDIVSDIFSQQGLKDFEFRAEGGSVREYCVQHNESDLRFVRRLLEEDGIVFFFEHSGGKHKMILVDQPNAYPTLPNGDLEYSLGVSPGAQIHQWKHRYQYHKGSWSLTDFDLTEPEKSLLGSAQSKSDFAHNGQFEHYEYPAFYNLDESDPVPKLRMQAEELDRDQVEGGSNCSQLVAGGKFSVAKHEASSEKGTYILLEVTHEVLDQTQTTGGEADQKYQNRFICVPSDTVIRPKLQHPRPVMPGPQTAWVVGPEGEEIYIDDYGRIKVQFHWDREGQRNEDSSCFLRVAQSWAGNQWGASFIPRIGQEVVVDFVNGDPDRPLVTGAVYNAKNRPVYSSKTQSGIKSRSTKGGGPDNYNEFRFEDKKGSEQILLHAEKDFDTEVENDQTLTVDNNRTKTVGNDENSTIKNDRNKTVSNNQTESIGKNKSIDVGDDHSESIGKNMTLSVGKSTSIEVGENHTETIGKNMTISVDKDLSETVNGTYTESVTKGYGLKAKSITMNAEDKITLKTGSASIVMKSNGDITISGKNINVKGSGNVVLKGSKVTNN